MHETLILQLLILLAVANGTPVIAKALLRRRVNPTPRWWGLVRRRPSWFGPSKTIRGIVFATLATAAAAAVLGLGWKAGTFLGIVAMAGDLVASFIKRRSGLAPSSQAIGLDQIPESLFPLIASRLFVPVTVLDIAVATILFFRAPLVAAPLPPSSARSALLSFGRSPVAG